MKEKDVIPVRLSQLVRMCAVGSLVRGPEYSVCVQDTRSWIDGNGDCSAELIPYVDQIRQSLDIVAELRSPPSANVAENGSIKGDTIPSVKFPKWTYCTASRLLVFNPWNLEIGRKGSGACVKREIWNKCL